MTEFNRPIPQGLNERLRENLKAKNVEKPASVDPAMPSFPVESIVPDSKPPQKKPINRGAITRRDDDDIKDIYIGIQDHDEAIAYYFNNVIKPSIIKNDERIAVPLVYGNPERWKSVQRDGYYRDKEGKIQTPLIMFKRDSVEKR